MSKIWKGAKAHVTGRGHLAKSIPCQDRVIYRPEKTHSSGIFYGLSLADGAGSYKHSEIGAEIVTDSVLKYLRSNFAKLFKKKDISKEIIQHLEDELNREAKNRKIDFEEFSSTLLFVVIKNDKYIAGHIGDGVIGFLNEENEIDVLSHPENGEYSNSTFFTTSVDYPNRLRVKKGNLTKSTGFIVMSDGSCESLYNMKTKKLAAINAEIINWLSVAEEKEVEEALKNNLDNIVKHRTNDDCSIGILKKC